MSTQHMRELYDVDGYGRQGLTRAYGTASLSRALLGQIKEKVGPDMIDAAAMGAVSQVQTLRLTGTSQWHTDCDMDGHQKRKSLKNHPLQVGFFFSNTNEDAYLDTRDGDLCIPIIEGTLVSFDGRLPHRTVVISGHVDMVGPFSLSSDVIVNVGGYGDTYVSTADAKKLKPMSKRSERGLSAAESSSIEGNLVVGETLGREENQGDHFLKVNGTGLPSNCTDDCAISIGLAESRECTEDIHDGAKKVQLPKDLFYSTDEKESTKGGWFEQMFDNVESENSPISLSKVFSMVDATDELIDSLTKSQLAPVVYLYDQEESPIACAFLEDLTDEEEEKYDIMFNGNEQEDADAAADEPVMGGGNGAGVGVLPGFAAVSAIMLVVKNDDY